MRLKLIDLPKNENITIELARLLGNVLIGDGNVYSYKVRRNDYILVYYNTERLLVERFIQDFYSVFNIKLNIKIQLKREKYGTISDCYFVRCNLKTIVEYFENFDLNKIENSPKEIKQAFLQACFDDDGCIDYGNSIRIGGWDKREKVDLIKKLLIDIGIKPIEYFTQNKYYYIRLLSGENRKFQELINFSHPLKRFKLEEYLKPRLCLVCGEGIDKPSPTQKFHKDCKKMMYRKKYPLLDLTCPYCKLSFKQKRKDQVYCSKICKYKYNYYFQKELKRTYRRDKKP